LSADIKIREFTKKYFESKEGSITQQSEETFIVTYPTKEISTTEYTYLPAVSRERKIPLLSLGSPAFQRILDESIEEGGLCQILLSPKVGIEEVIKEFFKDSPFACENCEKTPVGEKGVAACMKSPPCYHKINNGKISAVKTVKKEPVRFFQFYYSVTFHNKLRQKSEELITILLDEEGNNAAHGKFHGNNFVHRETVNIQNLKSKIDVGLFDNLKTIALDELEPILKKKVILFDWPLQKETRSKLRSFDKRLRRERREKVISRKHEFDLQQWHANHEALLRREKESYLTTISVKLVNLLIINTSNVKYELILDNNAAIRSSFILGLDQTCELICPICKKTFYKGYATQDSLYVCGDCIRQSVDSGKLYSKKAALSIDETLGEYFEHDSGFVCTVCGKRHSRLLQFHCSHDDSSVCIHHYDVCDTCGKAFSKLNLTYTDEFRRKLCPKHAAKNKPKEQ
jgi:hypothetical protein